MQKIWVDSGAERGAERLSAPGTIHAWSGGSSKLSWVKTAGSSMRAARENSLGTYHCQHQPSANLEACPSINLTRGKYSMPLALGLRRHVLHFPSSRYPSG